MRSKERERLLTRTNVLSVFNETTDWTQEQVLWGVVLYQGLKGAVKWLKGSGKSGHREDFNWVNCNTTYVRTFIWCCETLNLDPIRLRKTVFEADDFDEITLKGRPFRFT